MRSLFSLTSFVVCSLAPFSNAQPSGWWKNTKGHQINSAEELDTMIDEHPTSFILVDFYMEQCHWCF